MKPKKKRTSKPSDIRLSGDIGEAAIWTMDGWGVVVRILTYQDDLKDLRKLHKWLGKAILWLEERE